MSFTFNGKSIGTNIVSRIKINTPFEIVSFLNSVFEYHLDHVGKDSEFCVCLAGKFDNSTGEIDIDLSKGFFVPKQEVTSVHIKILEQIPLKYNVVIHRHPKGCTSFSGTDEKYLNDEFLASLLFIPPFSFPQAITNISIGATKLRMNGEIVFQFPYSSGKGEDEYETKLVAKKAEPDDTLFQDFFSSDFEFDRQRRFLRPSNCVTTSLSLKKENEL